MDVNKKIAILKEHIKEYPNFPKTGVLFRDIFSIYQNPQATQLMRDILIEFARNISPKIEGVAGLDARGFLLAPMIAMDLQVPFVPLRKKGKLPGNTINMSYSLEYGENTLELQTGIIQNGQNILIVDDLLATGGSLNTACQLIRKEGGNVAACLVLMELTELNGRSHVPSDIISIIKY